MDSIKITTGEKRIAINDDPNRIIVFNPTDVIFVEKFYKTYGRLNDIKKQYKDRIDEVELNKEVDSEGVPVNFSERLEIWKDIHAFIRSAIDDVFGVGASQTAFGDAMPFDAIMYEQFFNGIMPFVQSERSVKIEKYTNKRPKRK